MAGKSLFPSLTSTYHTTSYPAIDPSNPALSTANKSLLITGGGTGIGQAAALSFARSGISFVALLGRREAPLQETAQLITKEAPSPTVQIYSVDLADRAGLEKAVTAFAQTLPTRKIDILFANAGSGSGQAPVASLPVEILNSDLAANVIGNLNLLQLTHPHLAEDAAIIHTSTGAAHANIPNGVSYGISKLAGAMLFQQWALENPTHFVINFAPGYIDTHMAQESAKRGLTMGPFDDMSLPSNFAIWAASQQARRLGSGKFVWAHWDVDEVLQFADAGKFQNYVAGIGLPTPSIAQIGLRGWPPADA